MQLARCPLGKVGELGHRQGSISFALLGYSWVFGDITNPHLMRLSFGLENSSSGSLHGVHVSRCSKQPNKPPPPDTHPLPPAALARNCHVEAAGHRPPNTKYFFMFLFLFFLFFSLFFSLSFLLSFFQFFVNLFSVRLPLSLFFFFISCF